MELAGSLVLLGGLALAARADLATREIDDRLWQGLGAVGAGLGAVVAFGSSAVGAAVWLLVAAFALEHLFPWDDALGERADRYLLPLEVAIYLGVVLVVGSASVRYGIGGSGVSVAAFTLLATVLLARGLFELGVLYGGADAKAVIVAGLLLPTLATPLFVVPGGAGQVLAVVPFAVTLLTNAALFSLAVPLVLVVRNLRRGEFTVRRGFTGYSLAVRDLPSRHVWVRDERVAQDTFADDTDTSEEDRARRRELARSLAARGVERVWVSPQIPFVVLMGLGALAGVLFGNLLLTLIALLP